MYLRRKSNRVRNSAKIFECLARVAFCPRAEKMLSVRYDKGIWVRGYVCLYT